jgi:large subunit ribosomal protein L29
MPTQKTDFRGMSDEQLAVTLKDTEKHLFQLRFQSATDRLETPSEIRKAKKDIARIRTEQRRRELDGLKALPPDQLKAKVAGLEAKMAAGGPGKRQTKRRLQRLQGWAGLPVLVGPPPRPRPANARDTVARLRAGRKK